MDTLGFTHESDSDYPRRSLSALQMAHAKLFRDSLWKDSPIVSCESLFTLMENMKYGTSLPPSRSTFVLVRDHSPYYYRRPVWDAVDEVLKSHCATVKFQTLQERAAWFQNVLRLCMVYDVVHAAIRKLTDEVKIVGLEVDVGGFTQPISIILDPEKTGSDARLIARDLVPKMLEAVEALVNKPKSPT